MSKNKKKTTRKKIAKYYGNLTTKVGHDKGAVGDACRVGEIKPGNREDFESWEDMEEQGYRLCKICVLPDTRLRAMRYMLDYARAHRE